METVEYYGGTYPDTPEYEEKEYIEEDYEDYIADIIYEEKELELI